MRESDPAGKAEGESESEGRIYTETDQGRIKMKEQHSEAENRTELYEDVLLGKKLWTRLYRKLFWNGVSKKQIVKAMLKYIPEDFKGETAGCTGRNRTFYLPEILMDERCEDHLL